MDDFEVAFTHREYWTQVSVVINDEKTFFMELEWFGHVMS
jgi:hypothetical protein